MRQVRGAMVYPLAILGVAVIVVVVLLTKVIPVFQNMFKEMKAGALPAPTQFVINVSEGFKHYWYLFFGTGAAIFVGLVLLLRNEKGRMLFDGFIGRTASMGSPGVNELRWLAPLRPGDELTLDVDITEARISRSRPETGIVTFKATARNAAGQALCEMVSPIIIGRRDGAGAA